MTAAPAKSYRTLTHQLVDAVSVTQPAIPMAAVDGPISRDVVAIESRVTNTYTITVPTGEDRAAGPTHQAMLNFSWNFVGRTVERSVLVVGDDGELVAATGRLVAKPAEEGRRKS